MSTARSQPLKLQPHLLLPSEISLTLLTGTLGVNASFLAARFVGSALDPEHQHRDEDEDADADADADAAVVLVSWLRDSSFWKSEIRRGTVYLSYWLCISILLIDTSQGLDVTRPSPRGKFVFVDCFNNSTWNLKEMEEQILSILAQLSKPSSEKGRPKTITIILDGPDILLATTTATAAALNTFLLSLRSQEHVRNTILSLSADRPFLSAAVPDSADVPPTPIEVETASFITSQAHIARLVLSVRGLDTGAATDISGVLRATRGGGDLSSDTDVREGELLYLMQRDGNVKVFERGGG